MTIGIAAVSPMDRVIITVSDRMISFGDYTQAIDDGAVKSPTIAARWGVVWAGYAHDVWPIIEEVRRRLPNPEKGGDWSHDQIKVAIGDAYAMRFQQEFVSRELVKYGYKSIEEFKAKGRSELGDYFHDLLVSLGRFSLNAQFIVYGYNNSDDYYPHIFEVDSPGSIVDHHALNYAAVGSGHMMALASLRRRPMARFSLSQTIYRLLEAKFSAETATGVGKTTTVTLHNRFGDMSLLDPVHIDHVRTIWEKTIKAPDPADAIEFINGLSGVKNVSRDDD